MNKILSAVAPLTLLFIHCAALAQSRFEEEFDDRDKPWLEITVQIPPTPKAENLIQFEVGPTATHRFFVDARSLAIGSDGVIRFTSVLKTAGGAENISYEGIRCTSMEKKTYAFGHKDGKWTRSRRDQWEPITRTIANSYHAVLAQEYFCSSKVIAGNAEELLDRLRSKRPQQTDMRIE